MAKRSAARLKRVSSIVVGRRGDSGEASLQVRVVLRSLDQAAMASK